MRAAIYTRVSTEEQAADGTSSLQDQERRCRAFAEHKGWEVVDVYSDDGFTGTRTERPEWDRLMADAKAGKFGAVIVFNWKRFARNARAGLNVSYELEGYGVALAVTEFDVDTSTSQGRWLRTQMLGFAEYDRDQIVEQMAKGQYGKARNGGWPGGGVPYGYRQVGRAQEARVVLDQTEAAMIRKVVGWIVDEGLGRNKAADRLNAEGYRQRNGKPWHRDNLRDVLRNPALKGELWWGRRTASGKFGEPVMIRVEPAVLSPERFEALQVPKTWTAPPSTARAYPLGNRRMVTPCGDVYGGWYRQNRDRMLYRCRRRRRNYAGTAKCACPQLQAPDLERRVWSEVSVLLSDTSRLAALASEYLEQRTNRVEVDTDELDRVQEQITRLERNLGETVTEYMRAGLPVDAVKAATDQIKSELEELRTRQAQLTAYSSEVATADVSVLDLVERARSRLATMDRDQQTELLGLLEVRVTVLDLTRSPNLKVAGSVPWSQARGGTLVLAGPPSGWVQGRPGCAGGRRRVTMGG